MNVNTIFSRLYLLVTNRVRVKHIILCLVFITILQYFGAFTHIFEDDYFENFNYPLEGDIREYVEQLKNHDKPTVRPINEYNYSFLSTCKNKCNVASGDTLRLVYIIKSAMPHFERRLAIRHTWGYEKRFSDVPIRTVFILGTNENDKEQQQKIDEEQRKFGDIVQANFYDTYFNNTIKTMIGFKWATLYCSNSKFYMFSDDDMYISTKNVLRFVRNPTHYPEYMIDSNIIHDPHIPDRLAAQQVTFVNHPKPTVTNRNVPHILDFELPDDVELFSGYVFFSAPHRHRSSKWHVSLSEYPYHMWPPYVTAGAYILSHNAMESLYYASFFTKHFRFDDVYLGILAKKVGIEPYHCNEFYFYKKEYKVYQYRYVIASHGYDNPHELLHVWNEMRSSGYA